MASGSLPPSVSLDTSASRAMAAVTVVFPLLAILAVVGRFYGRHITKQYLGADDWIMIAALVVICGQVVIVSISLSNGALGQHINNVLPSQIELLLKLLASVQFDFGLATGLPKVSMCLFLVRIFAVKSFRTLAWIVMTYCICWIIMVILIGAFLCRPFAYNWDKTIPGVCGDLDGAYVAIAATDIVGDVLIILLPMKHIWNLQLPSRTKVELSLLFSLGAAEIVISILRIVTLLHISFAVGSDFTYDAVPAYIFSVIEPSLGVIIACAPCLRPAFSKLIPGYNVTLRFGGRSDKGILLAKSKGWSDGNEWLKRKQGIGKIAETGKNLAGSYEDVIRLEYQIEVEVSDRV